jgi:hypothetical protein
MKTKPRIMPKSDQVAAETQPKPIVLIETVEGFVPESIKYSGIYKRRDKDVYLLAPRDIKLITNYVLNDGQNHSVLYFYKNDLCTEAGNRHRLGEDNEDFYNHHHKYPDSTLEGFRSDNGEYIDFSIDFFKRLDKAYFMMHYPLSSFFSYGRYGRKYRDHHTEFASLLNVANKFNQSIEDKIWLAQCKHEINNFNYLAKHHGKINFIETYCNNNRSHAPDFMENLIRNELFY